MNKQLRRGLSLALTAAMGASLVFGAGAANPSVTVTLDGEVLTTQAYVDENWRTQVPLSVLDQLGVTTALKTGDKVEDTSVVEGYVPLRYVVSEQDFALNWIGASRTAALTSQPGRAVELDSIKNLQTDYSQAAQLPCTGYFTKKLDDGRSVKIYIASEASTRSYFTVVAVPDGVNTYEFLKENGWFDLADQKGEGLFVLEPGEKGWGSAEEEAQYLAAAMGTVRSGAGVFSTFGEFYLAGYGKGAAVLESWAAANPIFVISQVYVDGQGLGQDALAKLGAEGYDGTNTSGYHPGLTEEADFTATLEQTGVEKITRADVPVPTWFAGYAADDSSIGYWKSANDCEETAEDGVFFQTLDSSAPQTLYANSLEKAAGAKHGISQVKVSSESPKAAEIYSFLSTYTRYDNSFAYSNALAWRLDYTAARVGAQKQALAGKASETLQSAIGPVELWGQSDVKLDGHGTVVFGVFTFSDNNEDGKNDPREYMLFFPEGYEGKKLPVVVVYPGMTQTDEIFFDCTQWYQVAEKEGFAVAVVCETYTNPTTVIHIDADLYQQALMCLLKEKIDGTYAELDFTRVYGTGQSMGSMTTQGFVRTNPEFFAAVASTSGLCGLEDGAKLPDGVGEPIPSFLLVGQSDLPNLLPDLWNSEVDQDWINYLFEVNGMTDAKIGTAEDKHEFDGRTNIYTWTNKDSVPMVRWGQTLLRPHNCYPSEMPLMWDFLKHFCAETAEDGTVTRGYSASAFEKNDVVAIP